MSTALKEKYTNFISDQQHSDYHAHILSVREEFPEYPVFNVEYMYEAGPLSTYGPMNHAGEMRATLWSICMAGGYGVYYFSDTAWGVIVPGVIPPGYAYTKWVRDFFETTRFWSLSPRDEVVSSGAYALVNAGHEVIIYAQPGVSQVTVTLGSYASDTPLTGHVYDPRTGQAFTLEGNSTGQPSTLEPPPFLADGQDWVVHLVREGL